MTESISKKPSQDFREGTSVTHWGVVKTTVVDGKISKIEPILEDRLNIEIKIHLNKERKQQL